MADTAETIVDLMEPDIRNAGEGQSELRFDLNGRSEFTISTGAVQGGVVAVMLDMAMAIAAQGELATASLQYEILRPVMPAPIEVRGRVVRRGKRITFVEAVMTDGEGQMIAKGTQTAVTVA